MFEGPIFQYPVFGNNIEGETYSEISSGGIKCSGNDIRTFTYSEISSNGIQCSGDAYPFQEIILTSAGIKCHGIVQINAIYKVIPSKGVKCSAVVYSFLESILEKNPPICNKSRTCETDCVEWRLVSNGGLGKAYTPAITFCTNKKLASKLGPQIVKPNKLVI